MTEQETKVLNAMQYGEMVSRKTLVKRTGITDRRLREVLSQLKQQGEWIVNLQYGCGYVRLRKNKKNLDTVTRYVMQEKHRAKKILENIKLMEKTVKYGLV